jgi:uncharacterized membrane protein YphA (DoxX/SURF4 family)
MRTRVYWAGFVLCQILGFALLSFVNVHMNLAALFFAVIVLVPGGVLLLLSLNLRLPALGCLIVLLNLVFWWSIHKFGGIELRIRR